mgnify:CR=1 FL=1
MGRFTRWLIGTAISIALPIGLYYGFVHDVGEKKLELDEDYQIEDIFYDLIGNCLDNTKTDGTISLTLKDKAENGSESDE